MKKTIKLLSLLLALGLLTGCGGNPASNSTPISVNESGQPSQQSSEPINDGFVFDDDELNTPQEIHTADQKAYLNFSKPYYEITGSDLNSFNATGASR